MDGRKRPAGPRSRDNSPPTQRRRRSEQSTVDRYANTASPRGPYSPPDSRNNSATGLPADVRTGHSSHSSHECHTDRYRLNSNRDVFHDYDRLQNGATTANYRKPSTERSPRHVVPAMSNGSGSNTPVQSAPMVPSMLPVQERPTTSESAPMDILSALRSRKTSRATNVAQGTDGVGVMEFRALKAQMRLEQSEGAKSRNRIKQLEDGTKQLEHQLKQFEAVPAQLAALKAQVEDRDHAAEQRTLSDNMARRLSALENPKPDAETAKLVKLQSDVQTIELDIKKLNPVPEQLKQLQTIVSEHKTEVAKVSAKTTKLETNTNDLASMKEDVKAVREDVKNVKEQRQAMKGDAVKGMIQTAMQLETKKMATFRTENDKALKDMSTKVAANETFCNELKRHNLPGKLQILQEKIKEVESNDGRTYKKVTALEGSLSNLHDDNNDLYDKVRKYIGPIRDAFTSTRNTTVLERIGNLEALRGDVGQVRSFQSEQSKLAQAQRSLQTEQNTFQTQHNTLRTEHDKLLDQTKAFEKEQIRLSEEHKPVAEQVEKSRTEQGRLANQQESLQAEQSRLSDEQKSFTKTLESLNDRATASQETANQVKPLTSEQVRLSNEQKKINDRMAELESAHRPAGAPRLTVGDNHVDPGPSSSEVEDIQRRLQLMHDQMNGELGLVSAIDLLQEEGGAHDEKIHNNERDIALFRSNFVALFNQNFDPFKAAVEQQLDAHTQITTRHSEALAKLDQQVAERPSTSPAPGLTAAQLTMLNTAVRDTSTLNEALGHLQESIDTRIANQNRTVRDLKERIDSKQDTLAATQATDTVKAAVRNLQNQYDNISTDDLHQKMVHWFLQHYPSSPADLVQQFGGVKHDVAQLLHFKSQIEWIQQHRQALEAFVQIEQQLQTLVRSPSTSNDTPQLLATTNEALTAMKGAMAKVQQENASLSRTVEGLQKSMHALNSSNTPFAKAESLQTLEQLVLKLRDDVDEGFEEARSARNVFRNNASAWHDQRVKAETNIRLLVQDFTTTINNRFRDLETGRVKTISEHVEKLQSDSTKLRADFDGMLKKFIEPNEDLLNRLLPLFATVGQLQYYCEDLNQNLPKGPLKLSWTYDFNHGSSAAPSYESEESPEAARKGKRKQ